MKLIIFILSFTLVGFKFYGDINLEKIRSKYYAAAQKESAAIHFFEAIEKLENKSSAEAKGYLAMSLFLKANYSKNPLKKLDNFKAGKNLLEKTIQKHPNNIELLFLRLTIQTNAPKILGYKNDIESDLGFILKKFKTIKDKDLKNKIRDFLKTFYLK